MPKHSGPSMYEVGQVIDVVQRSKSGSRSSVLNSPTVQPGDTQTLTAAQLKTALLRPDAGGIDYILSVREQIKDRPEVCAHLVSHLTFTQTPAFTFSLTTTLTPEKAEITMVGRGGMLFKKLVGVGIGPSKQLATQQAYVAFVDQLCGRVLRGPSVVDRVSLSIRRMLKRG